MTTLSLGDYADDKRCQGRNAKILLVKEGAGTSEAKEEEAPEGGVKRGADSKPRSNRPSEIKVFRVSEINDLVDIPKYQGVISSILLEELRELKVLILFFILLNNVLLTSLRFNACLHRFFADL